MATGGSTVLSELEDLVTCAVCLGTYDDPRALPCLHNFCLQCLRDVFSQTRTRDNILLCPTCRTGSVITDGTVDSLPRCFQVEKIKTIFQDHSADDDQAISGIDYTLCSYDDNDKAVSYCFVCTRMLCDTCKVHHDRRSGFDKHFQLAAAEKLLNSLVCKKHNKLLEAYCTECWEPVCQRCHIDSHSGGRHTVHDFCACTEETHNVASCLQRERNSLQISLREVEVSDRQFNDHIDDIHAEITMRKEALLKHIDEQEKSARDELEKYRQDTNGTLMDAKTKIVAELTGLDEAHGRFLNITQPLPQAPSVTIVNASVYLGEVQRTIDLVFVPTFEIPKYNFKPGKGEVSFGTVEQDIIRPKKSSEKSKRNSRGSTGDGNTTKSPSQGSNPKTNFLQQIFGTSRSNLSYPEQKWRISTPGTVENICCTSQGEIIALMQDPFSIQIYNMNGEKQSVPPQLSSIKNSWRAAVFPPTSNLAVVKRSNNPGQKSYTSLATAESTVMILSIPTGILLDSFSVDGSVAAISFTHYEDIVMGVNEPTTALKLYNRDGTLQWERKLQHSCYRIAVDHDDRIIVLGTSHVHVHDSKGITLFSFPSSQDGRILQAPRGVYPGYHDGILLADQTKQKVLLFSSSGSYLRDVLSISGTPRDITLHKERYLVIGTFDKQLFMFDLKPSLLGSG